MLPVGIIGNMGPEADELMQRRLREAMGITCDQQALPMVVVKNPAIPDRTAAILAGGASPVPELVAACRLLEACGVREALMPCNTAHYFLPQVQAQTRLRILDMLELTIASLSQYGNQHPVGLLATSGTIQTRLYHRYANRHGIHLLTLNDSEQEKLVHAAIYGTLSNGGSREPDGIKAGCYDKPVKRLTKAIRIYAERGAGTVILGCTELPILEHALQLRFPNTRLIDPMRVTAQHVAERYRRMTPPAAKAFYPSLFVE